MNLTFATTRILDHLEREHDMPRSTALMCMLEYQDTHGEDAVLAMYGFLRYAANHQLSPDRVRATIVHDLNGRTDKIMLPQTNEYLQFAED